MKHNSQEPSNQKTKLLLKRIFLEHWTLKLGAIAAAVLLWLCIGYLL